MPKRNAILAITAVLAGLGVFIYLLNYSSAEVALSVANVEATQILNQDGSETSRWLVTLEMTNLTSKNIHFDDQRTKVHAKLSSSWVEVENNITLWTLWPHHRVSIPLLLSPSTVACRLDLEYRHDSIGELTEHWFVICGFMHRFPRLSAWIVRKLPHSAGAFRIAPEIAIPDGPTWDPPVFRASHNNPNPASPACPLVCYADNFWRGVAGRDR